MKMYFGFSILLVYILTGCDGVGVCYKYLGCFSQTEPWVSVERPFPPPADPMYINATLMFCSRTHPEGQLLDIYPNISFNVTGFSPNKTTLMIIHGYGQSGDAPWVTMLKTKYLENIDANVFVVNWSQGANIINYLQAAANARVVGAILGRFSTYLIHNQSVSHSTFHMIGHSLGAHIAGYAANITNKGLAKGEKVFRITALDAAQPGFQNLSSEVRLTKDNAQFIDAIHSDAKPFIPYFGFGYLSSFGDVDFYLNKGYDQPGCKSPDLAINSIMELATFNLTGMKMLIFCSHARAFQVFVASIDLSSPCEFIGHMITGRQPITSNQFTCSLNGSDCIKMGLNTPNEKPRGSFQVVTTGKEPYC